MRTGITLNPDGPLEAILDAVRLAEDLGFDDCYVADQGLSRDVYVVLSLIVGATSRIQIGPGVTHPYIRHPAATAVAVASLDEASGGRAFLGLGAGGSRALDPLRLERIRPLQACREAATIARLLWSQDVVDHDGVQFHLDSARLREPCRTDIELHWAARGPRMLALGGEIADVVMLHGIPRFEIGNAIASVGRGASEADRTVELQYVTPLVFDERSWYAARMRTVYRIVDSTEQVAAVLDLSPELVGDMRSAVTTRGPEEAAHLVTDDVLRHFVLDVDSEDAAAALGGLFDKHPLTGLTIEISEPNQAPAVLARAAELISQL